MGMRTTLQPPGWPRPKGYSNGISVRGRMVFTAGVVGWDEKEQFAEPDLAGQFRQILVNTLAILAEDDAGPADIVRMTWYVTSREEYLASLADIGGAYRDLIGKNFPTMAVIEVTGLVEAEAKIEIETIAVVPD